MISYILGVVVGIVIMYGIYKLVRHNTDAPHSIPPSVTGSGASTSGKPPVQKT